MAKVLILEDSKTSRALFLDQLEGEPVEVVIAETAAEARDFFESDEFDVIALDGIAPSAPDQGASLVGPLLAREFRNKGYKGFIVAISSDSEVRALTKKEAGERVLHRAYACEKLRLADLIRELLLGIYPTSK
ncbi:MAG: hypothetical protein Q8P66_00400 [Candidatus Colwellbacteria bacterium]|nr:hypothetical protein [Candidatus Colwellbacteria bacterium]